MKLRVLPKFTKTSALSFFFLILILGFLTYLFFSHTLEIKKISCSVDGNVCPDYVQAELEKSLHHSLFFTRYDQLINNLMKRQPSFLTGQVQKNLSGEVNFAFTQTKPVFALKTANSPFFLIYSQVLIIDPF